MVVEKYNPEIDQVFVGNNSLSGYFSGNGALGYLFALRRFAPFYEQIGPRSRPFSGGNIPLRNVISLEKYIDF